MGKNLQKDCPCIFKLKETLLKDLLMLLTIWGSIKNLNLFKGIKENIIL